MRLFLALFVLVFTSLAAAPAPAAIQYTISIDHPERHVFTVEMVIPDVKGSVTVQMPAWNALYQIRDFSSHMRQVSAQADGKSSPIEKLDKQTWSATGDGTIKVRYETCWDEPGPFATQLNSEHAFLNLAMVLLYVPDRRSEKSTAIFLGVPPEWQFASAALNSNAEFGRNRNFVMEAKDYDTLVDSPVEIGRFEEFDLPGVSPRIHVVIHGDNWKRDHVTDLLRRICRYELGLMRDAPFESYTFLFHIGKAAAGAGGGMEHSFSTAINVASDEFLAGVSAHEFFHLWNVKRIRPATLEPVDYTREQWTRALWFAEGVTSTYGSYTLLRSGIWTKDQFYLDLGNQISELESRPANRWQSAEESSLNAWLEKYPLYNSADESVSYYTKGQMLGVLLDIQLRERTGNAVSLDDLLRHLNSEFAKKGRYYRDSLDIRLAAEKFSGTSFEEFFRRYVSGTDPLPWAETFALAGLDVRQQQMTRPALGFSLNRDPSGEIRVTALSGNSPAASAGLKDGDVIAKWNDGEIPRRLERWLRDRQPGEKLRLLVRREGKELALEFPFDQATVTVWIVSEQHAPSEKAARIREGILQGMTRP